MQLRELMLHGLNLESEASRLDVGSDTTVPVLALEAAHLADGNDPLESAALERWVVHTEVRPSHWRAAGPASALLLWLAQEIKSEGPKYDKI